MPQNNRIYYAAEAVGFAPFASPSAYVAARGVQSAGISGRLAIEYIHELGNLPTYDSYEDIPEVEISLEKVCDGHPPLYTLATQSATTADLAGRANQRAHVALSIHRDTVSRASGNQVRQVVCSGVYLSTVSWEFPVSGPAKEAIGLVGNNRVWATGSFVFTGLTAGMGVTGYTPAATEGVNRRQHLLMSQCRFPTDIPGISSSGTNDETSVNGNVQFSTSFQNIRVATNFGRAEKRELGRKGPYFRAAEFPMDVTTTFEFIGKDGDMFDMTEAGVYGEGENGTDQQILLKLKEGLVLNLGSLNRLNSTNHSGAQAGSRGSDVMLSFTYTNQNDLIVQHPLDPTTALRP